MDSPAWFMACHSRSSSPLKNDFSKADSSQLRMGSAGRAFILKKQERRWPRQWIPNDQADSASFTPFFSSRALLFAEKQEGLPFVSILHSASTNRILGQTPFQRPWKPLPWPRTGRPMGSGLPFPCNRPARRKKDLVEMFPMLSRESRMRSTSIWSIPARTLVPEGMAGSCSLVEHPAWLDGLRQTMQLNLRDDTVSDVVLVHLVSLCPLHVLVIDPMACMTRRPKEIQVPCPNERAQFLLSVNGIEPSPGKATGMQLDPESDLGRASG